MCVFKNCVFTRVFYVCFLSCVGVLPVFPNFANVLYGWPHVLRGTGVFDLGKIKIEFSVVSDSEECQLPDAFYWIKKYYFQPKLSNFEILRIQVITVHARTLNSPTFFEQAS